MSEVVRGRNDLWGVLLLGLGVLLTVTAFAGVSLFQIGAVAFFVWLALARDKGWAWLPAAFFGFHVAGDLLDGRGGSLFFPLMVVAAGVLMLSKERLSKNATIGILLLLAVVGVASSNRDSPPDPPMRVEVDRRPPPAEIESQENTQAFDLDGRDLVVSVSDRDVRVSKSRNSQLVIGDDEGFEILEEPDFVLIKVDGGNDALDVRVPAEAKVSVQSTSGHVTALAGAFSLDIESLSGDVDVDLDLLRAVRAETKSGDITHGPYLDADADPSVFVLEGPGSPISIETISGDISIEPA